MTLKPIVVAGSLNLDVVVTTERIPLEGETVLGESYEELLGGKGANQAVGAAKLGATVAMIGRVGDDSYGVRLLEGLKQAGVNASGVSPVKGPSGIALITRAQSGANSIVVIGGANQALDETSIESAAEAIRTASVLLLQLEIPLPSVLRAARIAADAGVPVMLDPAPAQDLPPGLLQEVTWLTPNETEAATLLHSTEELSLEATADRLLSMGARNVALKLGERGVFLKGQDCTSSVHLAAIAVEAVDTTAAGDCFNAAFATQLAQGKQPADAARYANAAAAIAVTRYGAQNSMPTASEVEDLLKRSSA
ncbi:MAG: ribokinase [Edaphobacter sp.]|uniref:ribokinase n=1 Tax=Edaphobacter sp. TaxID=1934404 RepID=UPI002387DB5D|nr:ribokinase [Edaphobacter sp.]MDE1177249.1 ribokinase [Edaphobacter sp.]